MIVCKLLGVLLILAVGVFASYSSVRYEKRRLTVIDGWIDLIFYIRSQIDCFLMPIGQILENGEQPLLQACASISPDGATDLSAILRASSLYLDGEGKRLLEAFVREIGSSYREEQIRRCDYYISSLQVLRAKIADALPMRIRLCAALCMCIALGIAILLW